MQAIHVKDVLLGQVQALQSHLTSGGSTEDMAIKEDFKIKETFNPSKWCGKLLCLCHHHTSSSYWKGFPSGVWFSLGLQNLQVLFTEKSCFNQSHHDDFEEPLKPITPKYVYNYIWQSSKSSYLWGLFTKIVALLFFCWLTNWLIVSARVTPT